MLFCQLFFFVPLATSMYCQGARRAERARVELETRREEQLAGKSTAAGPVGVIRADCGLPFLAEVMVTGMMLGVLVFDGALFVVLKRREGRELSPDEIVGVSE